MVSRSPVGTMAQSCAQAQKWVHENYEKHPDGVVAKSVIYKHYEDYCKDHGRPVMETSIFGRVVKQVFHDVNIRRLGGRDNLKYYYCGIQAQASSPYVSDNSNTTRPKRKQRKREVVADKAELQNLVRWLCSNYAQDSDGSVPIHDLFTHYIQCSSSWTTDPVNLQQLTTVVMSVFPSLSKRKIGPKSPQQNVFVGVSQRPIPLDASVVSSEYASVYASMTSDAKFSCGREGSNTPDDEEDYSCRTPESEESDMSAGNSENSCSEIKQECMTDSSYYYTSILGIHGQAHDDPMYKDEPVDYSIATLRLKDEPVESMTGIKEEKLSDSCFGLSTHDGRPPSHMLDSLSPSPSPPQKSSKNRIYKPRFHIDYHGRDWNTQPDIKSEKDSCLMESAEDNSESVLRTWLLECLEVCDRVGVNCDQVYSYYKKYCFLTNTSVLSVPAFNSAVRQTFTDVSLVRLGDMTLLTGVRVIHNSDIYGRVEEIILQPEPIDICQSWDPQHQASLEMSSPPGNSSSPITLDDDDEEEDIIDDSFSDRYRDAADDDAISIPEVMRDGKFYLKTWLTENFESVPEACVLKADAYRHYDLYIRSVGQTPFEMNVFGKIVRQVFPKVSIRRLGGRMKPQYHYCGITAKPTSPLYALLSGKDPAQRSRKKEIATDSRTAEIVIDWLRRSYEPAKDRLITKSLVYTNFNSYCASIGEAPVSLNYFGKLVKHCFPNVEVRKFGGRTEPNWYYFGLNPKDPSLLQHSMSIEEFSESSISQCDGSPANHSHSSSNPIAVPGCGSVLALDSPYSGSPQILMASGISQFHPTHQLLQQKQRLPAPYGSSPLLESRSVITPEGYPRSPGLSRAFKEGLMTYSSPDGQRTIRSPYEPDVAPDIFPRSPEETPAQTCRSPSTQDVVVASALHMSPHPYQPAMFPSSSPNSKRTVHVTHSPTGFLGRASLGPTHGLPGDPTAHKRIKHHQVAPQDYTSMYSGRS